MPRIGILALSPNRSYIVTSQARVCEITNELPPFPPEVNQLRTDRTKAAFLSEQSTLILCGGYQVSTQTVALQSLQQ